MRPIIFGVIEKWLTSLVLKDTYFFESTRTTSYKDTIARCSKLWWWFFIELNGLKGTFYEVIIIFIIPLDIFDVFVLDNFSWSALD